MWTDLGYALGFMTLVGTSAWWFARRDVRRGVVTMARRPLDLQALCDAGLPPPGQEYISPEALQEFAPD